MVANAKALFQLADSLDHAERYFFTLKNQDHDTFVSQGILRRSLENAAKPGDRDLRNELEWEKAGYRVGLHVRPRLFRRLSQEAVGATRGALA